MSQPCQHFFVFCHRVLNLLHYIDLMDVLELQQVAPYIKKGAKAPLKSLKDYFLIKNVTAST